MKLNSNLYNIETFNSFSNVIEKINKYKKEHPKKNIISLGIGDVSFPVEKNIINEMHKAVDDLSHKETFKGYGSYYGYDFLKEAIIKNEYKNLNINKEEIYISCGSKTDTANILELFDINSKIAINDIMYPIYKEGIKCLNRKFNVIKTDENNNFISKIPKEKYDLIYLCSPNNPLGIAYTKEELTKWINYAIKNNSVILYDNVYFPFITNKNIPKSIYEVEGSKKVAIEFRSFSKTASFTGVRCSYFVIPNEIHKDINPLWKIRTINRYNGTDYIAQKGAAASYSKKSKKLIKENIKTYMENAKYLKTSLEKLGFTCWGGEDSPYLWVKIKDNMNSQDYFDFMLQKLNIIITPGIIFGLKGDKYFRVSSLGTIENSKIAIERMKKYYEK